MTLTRLGQVMTLTLTRKKFRWLWLDKNDSDTSLERVLDKRCLGNRKGTQQHAEADKGRLKGYVLHPSAVKTNCKSLCEAGYANFSQTFFAIV